MGHQRRNKLESPKESTALASERTRSTPKAVIFDIGRVIVRLDVKRALTPIATAMRGAADQPAKRFSPEDAWEIIRADQRWLDWQEGRLLPAEWHAHLMRRLKLSLSYEEFRDAWNLVLDPELILSESLFVGLAARCRLALLSNTDPIHVAYLEQHFSFGRHFPVRIYSCTVGTSKPSPVIYQAALESLGVAAHEAVYIDDIQEFVDVARQMGFDAIRFENRELLELELRRRHLC